MPYPAKNTNKGRKSLLTLKLFTELVFERNGYVSMKLVKSISLVLIIALSMATVAVAADIFSVKTALNKSGASKSCGISVMSGEVLEFSADDLELRLGLKPQSLDGITVTALPKSDQGFLVLDGVNVSPFDFIGRTELDALCFVPGEEAISTSMTFIPRASDSKTTELSIDVLAAPNLCPEVQSGAYKTVKNTAVSGYITASDPESDSMRVLVVGPPVNGTVRFDGLAFTYTPYKDISGKDSFTICVVDALNNFSNKTVISIDIENPKHSFIYADMINNPSAYAAVKLRDNGVMSGQQIGGKFFFYPNHMTTRGEFLVMMLAAGGFEASMKPTVNTGLPNDTEIPSYLKPYVKKAIDEKIWSSEQPFIHDQIPTRAEAVVLVDRAAKITDVKDFGLGMYDLASIPDWAIPSYKDLAAYKMLDLYDNMAHPASALTNSYSADLVWQLWKHCHR